MHLVRHRTSLKQRVHAVLLAHGKPCPVSDLFGVAGRALLQRLALPEPWAGTVTASLQLIDELDQQITRCESELRRLGADHRYVPLLTTVPGIGWVLASTIAAGIGDIDRFATPRQLAGYTGLCPRVYQSGHSDRRGPLAKNGPRYLRWALGRSNSARLQTPALPRPLPTDKGPPRQTQRQGRPDRPRPHPRPGDLAHAHPQPTLRPGKRHQPPGRLTALKEMRHRNEPPIQPDPPAEETIEK